MARYSPIKLALVARAAELGVSIHALGVAMTRRGVVASPEATRKLLAQAQPTHLDALADELGMTLTPRPRPRNSRNPRNRSTPPPPAPENADR